MQALKKAKLTAYIILNTECPISQNVTGEINDLIIKYPSVAFIYVFTKWDSKQQINLFKTKYKLQTKIFTTMITSLFRN